MKNKFYLGCTFLLFFLLISCSNQNFEIDKFDLVGTVRTIRFLDSGEVVLGNSLDEYYKISPRDFKYLEPIRLNEDFIQIFSGKHKYLPFLTNKVFVKGVPEHHKIILTIFFANIFIKTRQPTFKQIIQGTPERKKE